MLKRTQQLTASAKRPSISLHLIPLLIKNETQINTKHDTIAGTLEEDTRVTSFLDFTFSKNETEKLILKRPDLETNFEMTTERMKNKRKTDPKTKKKIKFLITSRNPSGDVKYE